MSAVAVRRNLATARRDARRSLTPKHLTIALIWLAVTIVPTVVGSSSFTSALARLSYFALAAAGLNFIVGLGNMNSIGHGAFVATGALTATLMRTRLSMGFLASVLIATLVTAAAAFVVGHGAIRLRAIHLAVSSWLGAWAMTLFLSSFPSLSGGASGLVVPEATIGNALGFEWRLTPATHYAIATTLLIVVMVLFQALARSSTGLLLATIRQNPREAAAIGTLSDGTRLKLFVFGSAVAGLAGALIVHLSGIFDHRSFGVLLSVSLFVAVLVGRPARTFAPIVGAVVVALLPLEGQPLIPLLSTVSPAGELLAGCLLLGAFLVGTSRDAAPVPTRPRGDIVHRPDVEPLDAPRLSVTGATKRFGGVVAVDGVDLNVRGGQVHGVMGPNGSGKSTLLALISGHLRPDEGMITLDGENVTHLPATARLRAGVARSLQSTELFSDLTALQHFEAAGLVDRRYSGFTRSILRTPLARSEEAADRKEALGLLEEFGLGGYGDTPAERIPAGARRLLMMGIAVRRRRVILLDEPSAGMSSAEVLRAAGIILELRERGAAIVVVEHNMRLLKRVADVITVLDGGSVIATGPAADIYANPEVRHAYLGLEKETS